MANPIFQTVTVAKKDLYAKVKEIMTTAGWTNVSSNPATDYDVFSSTGEDGTKSLFIQMRDFNAKGSAATTSITTIASARAISVRLPYSYTPGAPGVAGTLGRANPTWLSITLCESATNITLDTLFTITYHCDKNRLIILFDAPPAMNYKTCAHFIGLPGELYCSEPGSKGMVMVSNLMSTGPLNNGTPQLTSQTSTFYASDFPGEYPASSTEVFHNTYTTLAPKNPNSAGKFHLSDIYYGVDVIGFRGRLVGVCVAPATGLLAGDFVTIGSETYKVFTLFTYTSNAFIDGYFASNAFPTNTVAVRIS